MATSFWQLINDYHIVIPIIQRDYAQGRDTDKVRSIRENILNALCDAIGNPQKPLELDFIYGYTRTESNSKEFYPLDGQQRLTTLFLLHWYTAAKEGHLHDQGSKLSNFTYKNRHSSEVFCKKLVDYQPDDFESSIREDIINQPWFFAGWNNDPTIRSMLVMLECIQEKVQEYRLDGFWELLVSRNSPVLFNILETDNLGLPDDLYIKMNSRGKELTEFEYFKGRFSEMLGSKYVDIFNEKIDQKWSDIFWNLSKDSEENDIAKKVDSGFLNFIKYITDMLIALNEIEFDEDARFFEKIKSVYSIEENVDYLFRILDLLAANSENSFQFFQSHFYMSVESDDAKGVKLFFSRPNVNLLKKCADEYDTTQRNNPFSIGEQLLLFGRLVHFDTNSLDFQRRVRKLRNLISNSEDTVRKEFLPSLLNSVRKLISDNILEIESKFNTTQVQEEILKEKFLSTNMNLCPILDKLEDHYLLQGCIAILGLTQNVNEIGQRFLEIFNKDCNLINISRAMFISGDYTQKVGWRSFLGGPKESAWRELFTPSSRRIGFENTGNVLRKLLSEMVSDSSQTIDTIIENYLVAYKMDPLKPKDWSYYFVKYEGFRGYIEGYYYWLDENRPFESVMLNKMTRNGRHWDPVLLTIKKTVANYLSMEDFGKPLVFVKGDIVIIITNHNNHFKLTANESNQETAEFLTRLQENKVVDADNRLLIMQNKDGLDIEDRIEKGCQLVEKMSTLQ